MAESEREGGRGWRGYAASGALGALALAALVFVAGSRGGATELAVFPPEKAAARARLVVSEPEPPCFAAAIATSGGLHAGCDSPACPNSVCLCMCA